MSAAPSGLRLTMAAIAIAVAGLVRLFAAQAPPPTASIAGRVESAEATPVPLKRAILTLNSDEAKVHVTTVADDTGAFQFTGLPAGRFTLAAAKAPFVTANFGASSPGKPGTPIVLASGEARHDVVVRLLHGAVISGTVYDTFGEPAPFQYMSVLRRTLTAAGRALATVDAQGPMLGRVPSYGITTDDRGVYRIYGLPPGEYVVMVGARRTAGYAIARQTTAEDVARAEATMRAPPAPRAAPSTGSMILTPPPSGPPPDAVQEVPVFYPGTVAASDATPVRVNAGEERTGIDIRIVLSRSGSIAANFSDASGRAITGGFAHVVGDQVPGGSDVSAQVYRLTAGPLSRPALMPGRYRVEARGEVTDAGQPLVEWGSADVTLNGGDTPTVAVTLEPAPVVSGVIAFDEATPASTPAVTITLEPVDPIPGSFRTTMTAKVERDRFTFPGVPPGRYRLRAVDRAPGASAWHLAAATIAGRDIVDTPAELRPNDSITDALVTMTRRTAELGGRLSDAAGQLTSAYTVVVFSADERDWYWNSNRIRGVHLATDGSYVVNDLPAGGYLVAALTDVDESDWFDPDFLARIRSSAVVVTLVSGSRVTQNLRIAGGVR